MEHMQEEHSYAVHMYNPSPPPPRSPSWTQLDTNCSSPSTPKGYYPEWTLGATDPHLNNGATSTHVWPEYDTKPDQIPCYTNNDIGLPDIHSHAYAYAHPADYRYFAPGFLLPPPNEHMHGHSSSYVLSLPQELSSSSLDTRQRPDPAISGLQASGPHMQILPPTLVTQPTTVSQHNHNHISSPTSLSPTSPFNGHHSPSPPFYPHSVRSKKDSDDEYHPDSETKRPRARPSKSRKSSSSSSRLRTLSPFPSSKREIEHKHTCNFPGCTLSFARARDLKRHFRLHSGELPYLCEACGKGFIRSDARGRHWRAQAECAEIVMSAMAMAEPS